MEPLVLLLEIVGLCLALCLLHSTRRWLGLAPVYVAIGLFEAFLFVAGKTEPRIKASLFLSEPADVSYMLFLPSILSGIVLVYVLEGTREAWRLLGALVLLYIAHGCIDVVVEYHATHPPPDHPDLTGNDVLWYSLHARAASLGALVVDFFVIIVSYQFLVNRLRRLPLVVPLFIATVLSLVSDSVVYGVLRYFAFSAEHLLVAEKLQAGIAAALPMAAYLGWRLRQHSADLRSGVVERAALEILWRRKFREMEQKYQEERQRFVYIKDTFSRYVHPEVVDAILDDPEALSLGGELRDVTVLFADIRGYSTLSEVLSPTEVIGILNRYFQRVSEVILERHGMINEFEGDAVLAIFGAPIDLPDHAERAVGAALRMLEVVAELNVEWEADGTGDRWREAGVDGFAIRVGVHSGPVVAGNVGSEQRIKYAVIGDTVNTASRVEGLNKELGTSLLVTDATRRAIEARGGTFAFEPLGEQPVKGRVEPVSVYAVRQAQ